MQKIGTSIPDRGSDRSKASGQEMTRVSGDPRSLFLEGKAR